MAAVASREVTTKVVSGVSFGFYSDDEIRSISVKHITSPIIFDNLKQPVPDGLYDSALGPVDLHGSCSTCKLNHHMCPGHFGHIELAVPVYHPLVFNSLYKLLRCVCLHCFQFRMKEKQVELYTQRLDLLANGHLVDGLNFSVSLADDSKGSKGKEGVDISVSDEDCEEPAPRPRIDRRRRPCPQTSHTRAAMQQTIHDFFSKIPKAKCANCMAESPAIKKEGYCKIFKTPLSAKRAEKNADRGTELVNVLETKGAQGLKAELAKALAKSEAARAKEKRKARKHKKKKEQDEDEDTNMFDEEAEEGSDESGEEKDSDMDVDGDDDDDEEGLSGAPASAGASSSSGKTLPTFMTVSEVREIMKRLWKTESAVLKHIYAAEARPQLTTKGAVKQAVDGLDGSSMFFLQTVPVAPNRFRPVSILGGQVFEHAQNVMLSKCINLNLDILSLQELPEGQNGVTGAVTDIGRIIRLWLDLQDSVNQLMDSSTAEKNTAVKGNLGIRQGLEKKEGLFRKNMMGKRVNFAARSVISPDPCIGTGEIGVPPYFAKRLSFPERVTPWNVAELRAMVERGPEEHPGAVAVEDEQGRMVYLARLSAQRRSALAKTLLSGSGGNGKGAKAGKGPGSMSMGRGGGKIVYRQLMDGDLMLTNRQPTLHKPGLMAHRARVLKGERTIRMHYANCATFNADFDGDEINLHLPQDHLGRAEGYHIVHADHQYIVPTDGKPIRGLIQDHIIGAVLITKRDTFYTRAEYQQLVYAACGATSARKTDRVRLLSLPPAVVKPRQLWTGKQVISTVLRNCTRGMPPLTLRCGTKTPADYFGKESQENESNFYQGELVAGIIDKAAFGKHGLVHGIQELYGNTVAGNFLSSLSRLFTYFTQVHGFTCGIDDVRLKVAAEEQRAGIIARAEGMAVAASAELMKPVLPAGIDPSKMPAPAVIRALSTAYRTNANTGVMHDMKVSGTMHPLSSEVVKACLPTGQVKKFPGNCMSLMTVTGAKGSLVNFSQISCLLGQQELEGRRTPRMASGKTLPCFAPYDGGARPGGFIGDRFLSGLRPQEYYFHCMAGRDGLVDTTVKTSRSGYLQRCLVKNLEALRVHYDSTVRDDTDGSIVQLSYGEDGLDMLQTSYMMQFPFLAENAQCYAQKLNLSEAVQAGKEIGGLQDGAGPAFLASQGEDQPFVSAKGVKSKHAASEGSRDKWCSSGSCLVAGRGSRLPAMSKFPPTFLGITSEKFAESLEKFIEDSSSTLLKGESKNKKKTKKKGADGGAAEPAPTSPDGFRQLMHLKYMQSLMSPGEAVGVLAAQSIGEPSTQMTLNTFHMAGRGEANVTMGIPRVREILMTAAKSIKTPVMKLPVLKPAPSKKHPGVPNPKKTTRRVKELASRLRSIRLAELLQGLQVVEQPVAAVGGGPGGLGRCYHVKLTFIDPALYPEEALVTFEEISNTFAEKFMKALKIAVKAALRKAKSGSTPVEVGQEIQDDAGPEGRNPRGGGGEDDGEEPGAEAAGNEDENDDDEEHEEGKMRWRSGRHELATYDDGDEEDQQAAMDTGGDEEDGDSDEDTESPTKERPSAGAKAKAKPPKAQPAQGREELMMGEQVAAKDFMCTTTVTLPLDAPKLLMLDIAERVAAHTFVRSTMNIEKCYTIGADQPGGPAVQTDGINFVGAFQHADLVDVNEITCNCVTSMLETFGVEAARATIVQEVRAVFGAYGIAVDPRHLNLIADYMTQGGGYRAMNRVGIESCTSPLLKMSFETAAKFLTQATLDGSLDDLASPASRIIAGRPTQMGTGCMDIAMNLS